MTDSNTTNALATAGHETCFLDLSAELRNEIYELALFAADENEQATQSTAICRINFSNAAKPMVPEPGLLRSCRQARADASPMFYGRTSFQIPLIFLTKFINTTNQENLAAIQELRVHDYVSQCTKNIVSVCKAIKAIKKSKLRMDAIKVCLSRPYTQVGHAVKHRDRVYGSTLQCQWRTLVELEDYYLHLQKVQNKVVKKDRVENKYLVQAIAPKQLEDVIERVKMENSQDDELTESLR